MDEALNDVVDVETQPFYSQSAHDVTFNHMTTEYEITGFRETKEVGDDR